MPTTTADTMKNAALTMTNSKVRVSTAILVSSPLRRPSWDAVLGEGRVSKGGGGGKRDSLLQRRRISRNIRRKGERIAVFSRNE